MLLAAVSTLLAADATGASGGGSTDIIPLLREFGFPILVVLWFMWRMEKRMDDLIGSLNKLIAAVAVMAKTVDDDRKK